MSGKTLSYVRRKLLYNGHSYQCLKTQKHSVCIGLFYSGFSLYEHFNRQFTYVFLCSKPRDVSSHREIFKKILYQYVAGFFALFGTASPPKPFYMSLHNTKRLLYYYTRCYYKIVAL